MLPAGWFLTACYVVIDPTTGSLDYSLAGHEAPLVVRARNGAVEQLADRGGLPVGPFPDCRYEAGRTVLEPGDTLVLFTDGVTERMNPARETFGSERLRSTLAGTAGTRLEAVRRRVLAELDRHAAGTPPEDDTTFLMLRRPERGGR
jgi:sigma-B regulation protein RsbU (phosphoserine phosphatase)